MRELAVLGIVVRAVGVRRRQRFAAGVDQQERVRRQHLLVVQGAVERVVGAAAAMPTPRRRVLIAFLHPRPRQAEFLRQGGRIRRREGAAPRVAVHAHRAQNRRLLQPAHQHQQVGTVDVVARGGELAPGGIRRAQRAETAAEPVRDRRRLLLLGRQRRRAERVVAIEVVAQERALPLQLRLPTDGGRLRLRRHHERVARRERIERAELALRAAAQPDAVRIDARHRDLRQGERIAARAIGGAAFAVAIGGVESQREVRTVGDRRAVAHVEDVGHRHLTHLQRGARSAALGDRAVGEHRPRRTQRRRAGHVDTFPVAIEVGEHDVAAMRDDLRHAAHVGRRRLECDRLAVLARQAQLLVATPVARAHQHRVGEVADQHRTPHRRCRVQALEQPAQGEHGPAVLVRRARVHGRGDHERAEAVGRDVRGVADDAAAQFVEAEFDAGPSVRRLVDDQAVLEDDDDQRPLRVPRLGEHVQAGHLGAPVAVEIERCESAHDIADGQLRDRSRREAEQRHEGRTKEHGWSAPPLAAGAVAYPQHRRSWRRGGPRRRGRDGQRRREAGFALALALALPFAAGAGRVASFAFAEPPPNTRSKT